MSDDVGAGRGSAIRRFAGNVLTHAGGKVTAALISALWMIVAVRQLSKAEFGDLAVLTAVGAFMIVISDLGYPFLLADAVSRSGRLSADTMKLVVRRRLLVALVGAVCGVAAYQLATSGKQIAVPLVFSVSIIATVVHSSMAAGLRGLGSFGIEAVNDMVSRACVLLLGWLVLRSGGGILGAAAVYAAADVVSLAAVWLALRPRLSESDDIDMSRLTFTRTWPLSTGRILAALYNRGDTWLMALLRSSTDAAIYAAPYRILEGLVLVPRSAGAVAVTHVGEGDRTGRHAWAPWQMACAVAAGMAVIVTPLVVFASPIITTLFGDDYQAAVPVFAVLAVSAVPGAIVAILAPVGGLGRGHAFAGLMFAAVLASLAANLVVIPIAGPIGAAWVNLSLQIVLAGLTLKFFGTTGPRGVTASDAAAPLPGS